MLLGGKVYEKADNLEFDTEVQPHLAGALYLAEKSGFVEEILEAEPETAPAPKHKKSGK